MKIKGSMLLSMGALLLIGAIGQARAVTLADLINKTNGSDGTLLNGDKLFDAFTYSGTGGMPPADQINVLAVTDVFGNYGIRFQAGWTNNDPAQFEDSQIGFDVTVTDPNYLISDLHLTGNPDVAGSDPNGALLDGVASVTETVRDANTNLVIGQITIFDQHNGGVESNQLDALVYLPQNLWTNKVRVVKDALFVPQEDGAITTMSFLDNYYSQSPRVPEPGSVAMLVGLAVGGSLFGFRLRRAKKA